MTGDKRSHQDSLVWAHRTPLNRRPPWNYRTDYTIVNWFVSFIWLLRVASPSAWILSHPRFQIPGQGNRFYVKSGAAEKYGMR
jgi:hypothetical protein